jgi:hypothetical protein
VPCPLLESTSEFCQLAFQFARRHCLIVLGSEYGRTPSLRLSTVRACSAWRSDRRPSSLLHPRQIRRHLLAHHVQKQPCHIRRHLNSRWPRCDAVPIRSSPPGRGNRRVIAHRPPEFG